MDPASRAVIMGAPTEVRTNALSAAQRFATVTVKYCKDVAGNRRFVLQSSRNAYRFDNGSNRAQKMPRGDAEELIRKYGAGSFEILGKQKVGV